CCRKPAGHTRHRDPPHLRARRHPRGRCRVRPLQPRAAGRRLPHALGETSRIGPTGRHGVIRELLARSEARFMNETARSASPPIVLGARPLEARSGVIVLLTAMTALGQFASNVYLPALPAVAADFSAPMNQVQWTLALFLVVFALGQLVYGPLSDRFGRLAPLKLGLLVYLAGSIGAALAPNLAVLLACRAVQAAGGAAGVVIARAMVRDSFAGPALARVMALISIVFGLVPGLSPLVGGIATDLLDWRATFWLTAKFWDSSCSSARFNLPKPTCISNRRSIFAGSWPHTAAFSLTGPSWHSRFPPRSS